MKQWYDKCELHGLLTNKCRINEKVTLLIIKERYD